MTVPLDLDGPPACPECGAPMIVTEWPGEGPDGVSMFSAVCSADTVGAHGEIVDRDERPTWRTEPGCAPLVAEIERLRSDLSLRADEMDRLCAELDRADPHAMTLLQRAVDRLEAERQAILDAGGDLLWAGGATTLPEAVAGALRALDSATRQLVEEYRRSPAAKVRSGIPRTDCTDASLVRAAIFRAKSDTDVKRWVLVSRIFGTGGEASSLMCQACGLDPEEIVGDDGEGEE